MPLSSNTNELSTALLAFIFRHGLSMKCSKDLLELMKFSKSSTCEIPSKIFETKKFLEFSFCNCFNEVNKKNFPYCSICNVDNLNYFTINDFLSQAGDILISFFGNSSNTINCPFTLYTDGISLFDKSNLSIWPIYMVFNNIPYKYRYNLSNICIVGIYFGNSKPDMQVLFKKVFNPHLNVLNTLFFYRNMTIKFIFKFLVCDKPAKSMCLNFQSHNATYFCPICIAKSKNVSIDNTRHIFVPLSEMFNSEPRTHSGFLALAYSAENLNKPDYGVKGNCFLSNIESFDIIKSNLIDYMHSLCLGIVKKTLDLILKKKNCQR